MTYTPPFDAETGYQRNLTSSDQNNPCCQKKVAKKEDEYINKSLLSRSFDSFFDTLDYLAPEKVRRPLAEFRVAFLTLDLHCPNYKKYVVGTVISTAAIVLSFYLFPNYPQHMYANFMNLTFMALKTLNPAYQGFNNEPDHSTNFFRYISR